MTWLARWAHEPDSLDASQRVDVTHNIGLLIVQANNAGVLQWGSSIYLQALQQSALAAASYEDRPPGNGVGIGLNKPLGGDIQMREAMPPKGANQPVWLREGPDHCLTPLWGAVGVSSPNQSTWPFGQGTVAQVASKGAQPASIEGIIQLAKAFPELPIQHLAAMQCQSAPSRKCPKKATPMVHGPSHQQVLLTVELASWC